MKKKNFVYEYKIKRVSGYLVVIHHGDIFNLLSELLDRYGSRLLQMRTKNEQA